MLAVLHNEALVNTLSAGGAPFLTRIDLKPDAKTGNGYRWSGGPGPATALSGGATGTARVTILEQRPISYVFGFLRKASGE
jgi:HlyD family secretion protein